MPFIKTNYKNLLLRSSLHVPTIAKNLLSVSKFTKDNNVLFESSADKFLVKCQETKKTLLENPNDTLFQ